jgi:hypothetical protein
VNLTNLGVTTPKSLLTPFETMPAAPTTAPPARKPTIPQSFASLRPPREGDRTATKEPAEYNLADHPPEKGGDAVKPGNSEITEALNKAAGVKVTVAAEEPKQDVVTPATTSPTPKPTKFIALDDPLAEELAAQAKVEESKATTAADPAIDTAKPPPKAAQLREAYDTLKADFAKAAAEGEVTRKELTEFRKKATAYEDQLKALEPLKPRIKEYEDKLAQYDERLRIIDYVQHPEFHEKYVKPVSEALANAHSIVKEMVVENSDGTQRLGNEQDFAAVLAAPNLSEATKVAKELFGPDLAQTAITHRTQVLTAERRRQEAVKDAGLKSQEFAKTAAERQHAEAMKFRESFQRTKEELAEKYAPIYKPDLNDKEIADTYQRGVEMVNAVMERDPATPNEVFVQSLARVYHRAANAPVLLLKNQRLQQEITALQEKLAAYEKSSPGAEGRKNGEGNAEVTASEDPRAELRRRLEAVANRKP